MKLLQRVRHFLGRDTFDSALAEEMQLHVEMKQDELVRQGMSASEARAAARREFGNSLRMLEDSRSAWSWQWVEDAWIDLRYSLRGFHRNRAFTGVAVLCMALGIGANTAIFSLINAAFLRPQNVDSPERIYQLELHQTGAVGQFGLNYPMFTEVVAAQKSLQALAAVGDREVRAVRAGEQDLAGEWKVGLASGNYFEVFPVRPALGRVFGPADDVPSVAVYPVVISHLVWTNQFHSDPAVVGRKLSIETASFEIAGVMPEHFQGIGPGLRTDFWIPIQAYAQFGGSNSLTSRDIIWFETVGRLAPDASVTQAETELTGVLQTALANDRKLRDVQEREPAVSAMRAVLRPSPAGLDYQSKFFEKPLKIMLGLVAAMLLMAVANVGGLLLARTASRQREIAVRSAIGAGRLRLCRQLLTESVLLACAGAALGVWLSRPACAWILQMLNTQSARYDFNYSIDARVLAFTIGVTALSTLLFGLAPMLWSVRVPIASSLGASARTQGSSRTMRLVGRAIVTAQIALATLLVGGSLLLVGSLRELYKQDAGFVREGILTAYFYPGESVFGPGAKDLRTKQNGYYTTLREKLRGLPGVKSVALTEFPPLSGFAMQGPVTIEQTNKTTKDGALFQPVSPEYFDTLGMTLLAGRRFAESDGANSPKVVVIDEKLAAIISPGESPVGKRVSLNKKFTPDSTFEVIGVVKASKFVNVRDTPKPILYRPLTQTVRPFFSVMLRTAGNPADLAPAVRKVLAETETSLPVDRVIPLATLFDYSINRERLLGWLSGVFAALALLLAAIGTYGLVSNQLIRRIPEIGIRVALGARRSDIARLVLGETVALLAFGLAIGIPLALYAGRLMKSQLFGLKPEDPSSIALTVTAILVAAALALLIPARRAMRVDPATALRQE